MPDGLAFGLFAALAWGSTDILAALASRRIGGFATAALAQSTSLLGLLAYVVATRISGGEPVALEWDLLPAAADLPLAIGVGLVAATSYLTFYLALRLGPVAVVSPVGSAYGAVAVVLSVLLLGERPTSLQAVGVVVATVGILAVSFRLGGEGRPRVTGPGVPFVVVALLTWGLMTVGIAALVRSAELLPALLAIRLTTTTVVWTVTGGRWAAGRLRRDRGGSTAVREASATPAHERRRAVGLSLGAGLLDITGYVAYATGLQVAAAWLVGLTSSFGPAVAFLFAVAFLGDRLRPLQWVGLAGLAAGLVLVGLP